MFDMPDLMRIEPIGQLAPDAMAGFTALGQAALAEGAIPKKYKESTAIAVALTTQCPYCIQVHREAALDSFLTKASGRRFNDPLPRHCGLLSRPQASMS